MEALTKFICASTEDLEKCISDYVVEIFEELYINYEMNPTHEMLNSTVTGLYGILYGLYLDGDGQIGMVPTLEKLMDMFMETVREQIPKLYGEEYDFLDEFDNDNEDYILTDEIPLDYRIPNIQHLVDNLERNSCCVRHNEFFKTQKQVFEFTMANMYESDGKKIDNLLEHLFINLHAHRQEVENHRFAEGKGYRE